MGILKLKQKKATSNGCLDWDSFATFLRLFSDADFQVRKRQGSLASTQAIQLCRVAFVAKPWYFAVPYIHLNNT